MGGFREYEGVDNMGLFANCINYNTSIENEILEFLGSHKQTVDFGAGAGVFPERLRSRGIKVDCVEIDPKLNARLKEKGFNVSTSLNSLTTKYHRIYTLNVIEHIEDDIAILNELNAALEKDGKLFIYVPAFMVLYSNYDAMDGHFRRYHKKELIEKLKQTGFAIEKIYYADSLGFLAWLALKFSKKEGKDISMSTVKFYDRYLFPISRIMDIFLKPFIGKNLLVIARKL